MNSITNYKNIPLEIKKVFLTFAQAYFAESFKFKWDKDVRVTKIIIADRNAIDLGVATKKPALILSRNPVSWGYVIRGQSGLNSVNLQNEVIPLHGGPLNANLFAKESRTDLLYGSVTFNALSKNGVQAEMIANDIFVALTGMTNELRKAGIFKFTGMSIGGETILRTDSEIRLIGVPVTVNFLTQEFIVKAERFNNVYGFYNNQEIFETLDFEVVSNGTAIKINFNKDANIPITIDYTDAITLQSVTGVELIATSDPTIFSIPNGGKILGYYDILRDLEITIN
jgi:hypothetical protein